jgi:hypothetical protein
VAVFTASPSNSRPDLPLGGLFCLSYRSSLKLFDPFNELGESHEGPR